MTFVELFITILAGIVLLLGGTFIFFAPLLLIFEGLEEDQPEIVVIGVLWGFIQYGLVLMVVLDVIWEAIA
jgi:hypothetical protein